MRFFAFILSMILVFSALKNDFGAVMEESQFWFDLSSSPFVTTLRLNSALLLSLSLIAAAAYILNRGHFSFRFGVSGLLVLTYCIVAGLRALAFDLPLGARVLSNLVLFGELYVLVAGEVRRSGSQATMMAILNAYVVFACTIFSLGSLEFYQGFGFVPGFPRFFGTTSHPNFFGVQTAVGSWAALCAMLCYQRWLGRAAALVLLSTGVFLLGQTGSRTGLILFISALYFALWRRLKLNTALGFLVVGIAGCGAFFASDLIDLSFISETFSRGGTGNSADNRSEVWGFLLDAIVERPLFGHGVFIKGVENSFLRGWADYGVIYAVCQGAALIAIVYKALDLVQRDRPETLFLGGLGGGLLCASVFEGYMVDALSLPVTTFFILVALYDPSVRWAHPATTTHFDR